MEADPKDPSKLRGFDVEIASELGRRMGRVPRFVQVAYSSIDQSVDRGDFEIGLSGVEDTPGRRAALSVTVPYFEFREVLTTRAGEEERFPDSRVAAGAAASGRSEGRSRTRSCSPPRRSTESSAVSYDDDVHPYEDVAKGRLDAVLLDHVLALRALTRTGGLAIVPGTVATGWYVGVLAKANAKGRDEVDRHLADMMRDGTLARIFTAWGLEDETQGKLRARVLAARAGAAARAAEAAAAPAASRARGGRRGSGGAAEADVGRREGVPPGPLPCRPRDDRPLLPLDGPRRLLRARSSPRGASTARGRLRFVLAAWVEVTRGTPVLLQLFVLYYGLSGFVRLPAFLAAVIGLGLNYAAYESEIYRGALESVGKTQLEAARTLGFTELQVLRLVRGPLAFRLALAPMTNDFVALLKDSSLVSVITVVELTKQTSIFAVNLGSWLVPGLLCGVDLPRDVPSPRPRGPPARGTLEGAVVSGAVLTVSGLRLSRGAHEVLKGVDLAARRGEIVALMGLSGGGKTTVLRSVAALEPFDAGSIDVDGFRLAPGPTPREHRLSPLRRKVALVFQQHGLFEHLDALRNVTLAPIHVLGTRREEAEEKAGALLDGPRRLAPDRRVPEAALGRRGAARRHRPRPRRRPAAPPDGRADRLARPGAPRRSRRDPRAPRGGGADARRHLARRRLRSGLRHAPRRHGRGPRRRRGAGARGPREPDARGDADAPRRVDAEPSAEALKPLAPRDRGRAGARCYPSRLDLFHGPRVPRPPGGERGKRV